MPPQIVEEPRIVRRRPIAGRHLNVASSPNEAGRRIEARAATTATDPRLPHP